MKKLTLILASVLLTSFTFQLKADKGNPDENKDSLKEEDAPKSILLRKPAAEMLGSKQVIKLSLSQLIFTNFSFQYEYAFHKNMSGALGLSFLLPRSIPGYFFKAPTDANTSGYSLPNFGGWAITPEFRFYPGAKVNHQAPHGFYFAPYFRYAKYTLKANYTDVGTNASTGAPYDNHYAVKASYYGHTIGLMIGSQWIIGKHFSIDWWIVGAGAGRAKFSIEGTSTDANTNLSSADQAQLNSDISGSMSDLGSFGKGTVVVTTTSNSAKVVVSGLPMLSVRAGLTLGFAF